MKRIRAAVRVLGVLAIAGMGAGCATSRGILDVRIPPTTDAGGGKTVVLKAVTDVRAFELKPRQASIPSLRDGQIANKAITSRAIARKRNGYGKALGDILLPEGRTVEELAQEAVVKALQEKGYSVAAGGTQGVGDAIPMEVDIHQFWAWFTPGFWAVKLEFEAILEIRGPATVSGEKETVRGYIRLRSQAANSRAWMNTINKGIDDLVEKIKAGLKEP